ncbi:MAG: carboxylating nicotinate-nucleotide diphosphorylase [Oscillatoriales cyanobacterium]|nr:MAG: carboxylating nicotinate-nucleotide diphosphorylase [Oscillatoriales cyanobacterium]
MRYGVLPHWLQIDGLLRDWLMEDLGRGDRATLAVTRGVDSELWGEATWTAKAPGVVAGIPIAERVFKLLDERVVWQTRISDGEICDAGETIAVISGPLDALLSGERVALNLGMRLSGVASLTRRYVEQLQGTRARLADTRKTTPGLRILEKYASQVGGAVNHRMGLDDSVMLKDNHLAAAGGVQAAVARARALSPFPLMIEVEVESLEQAQDAIAAGVEIVMLDNMSLDAMREAIAWIRSQAAHVKIEASGNITLDTIRAVAETGVDYISTSAPVTQSRWLDISMRIQAVGTP